MTKLNAVFKSIRFAVFLSQLDKKGINICRPLVYTVLETK